MCFYILDNALQNICFKLQYNHNVPVKIMYYICSKSQCARINTFLLLTCIFTLVYLVFPVCRWLLPLVALPFSFLPSWIHYKLFKWYFSNRPIHDGAVVATAKLVSPYCLRNVTNMANEEMQRVDVPDYHLLQRHRHKLWFYYGASDGWCPVKYCYYMLQRYPDADVTLCEHDIEHAFCLESSYKMAALTWKKLSQTVFKSPVCVVNNGIQQIQQS